MEEGAVTFTASLAETYLRNMRNLDVESDFIRFKQSVTGGLGEMLTEYGFTQIDARLHYPAMWVTYSNTQAYIEVYFEYGTGLFMAVHSLITSDDGPAVGKGHSVDWLLGHRTTRPEAHRELEYFDEAVVGEELKGRAALLKTYAADVLRGDFGAFA